MPEDHVTVFDVTTQTYTAIPQSELAPGMVRAEVEGHEGVVWIDADQLKASDYRQPPFSGERRDSLLRLVDAFPGVYQKTYEFWEDGFRRDTNPDSEIAVWMHIADVYERHSADQPPHYRGELFSLVVACSNADRERVGSIFQRSLISEADFHRVTADFYTG